MTVPHAVLSEQFQEWMQGQRLRSAAFLTFEFDPAFFEQEILPVLLDVPLSHAAPIRLLQIEGALRALQTQVAVYYDANGLRAQDGGAKLDVRRIPVRHRTGIFHPKNALLLVESKAEDEEGHHAQSLIVACLSANLTRNGWWENVEACHVEKLEENDRSLWGSELASFLRQLLRRLPTGQDHLALEEILAFLKRVDALRQRSSGGRLHTRFYSGREPLADFLENVAGDRLRGSSLEIVSPFFDDAPDSKPLEDLLERFQPKAVRIFLPRNEKGEGRLNPALFRSVSALPSVTWGRLPQELMRLGRSEDAAQRNVHAKVYRFFSQSEKRELLFIGSANLTRAAHGKGGNVETGFLVELDPGRRPEFWLEPDDRPPLRFESARDDAESAASGGSLLTVRHHWDRKATEVLWEGASRSPPLRLVGRGLTVAELPGVEPGQWTPLAPEASAVLAGILEETSILDVHGEADAPTLVLVQEEGMHRKPSLLLSLSTEDILRYWTLLEPDQKAQFIESRAPESLLQGAGAELVARYKRLAGPEGMFGRFAATFLAFGQLERTVRAALESAHPREAVYRLFGNQPDSLPTLLDRVLAPEGEMPDVDRYLILLCVKQVLRELGDCAPEFWAEHRDEVRALRETLDGSGAIRERLIATDLERMPAFLDWFDGHFLRRAQTSEEAA